MSVVLDQEFDRDAEIVRLSGEGLSQVEIGDRFGISQRTVSVVLQRAKIGGLACPNCGESTSGVVDSRLALFRGVAAVRRRRPCEACGEKFTTFELSESTLVDLASVSALDRDMVARAITDLQRFLDEVGGAP